MRKTAYSLYSKSEKGHNSYKYTRAPQTVHNTPIMNILKGIFLYNAFLKKRIKETKVKFKISAQLSMHIGGKFRKNYERTERQTVAEWRHLNLICNTLKQRPVQNFSSTSQRDILSSQRSITPSKMDAKWQHSNLLCSTLKLSHVQNFSSIQWWFVNPDTFVPARNFRINEFSGLLNLRSPDVSEPLRKRT